MQIKIFFPQRYLYNESDSNRIVVRTSSSRAGLAAFQLKLHQGGGQDGGRVRRGDHLPSHRYSRNTSMRGTAPTEHPLNAGRRRQTSQKARNSPRTWVGQKKKEITETKE